MKGTGYPWQPGANVYIAGHDLGYPGTPSEHIFWNLQKLDKGDEFTIEDSNRTVYTYHVYRQFQITPSEVWVMRLVAGKNITTLQTCRPHGIWTHRLVVRAELVDVSQKHGRDLSGSRPLHRKESIMATWILAGVVLSCFVGLFVVIRRYQVIAGRLDRLAAENRRLKAELAEQDELVAPTGAPTDTLTDTPKWIRHDEVVPLRKPRRVSKEG